MATDRERRVPQEAHRNFASHDSADWDGARVFLEIARSGSFRSAALRLGQSVNALRHRFSELERRLGATLLTRHVDGVRLTAEGERVLAAAQEMESASFNLIRAAGQTEAADTGEISLAITEGLGTFWIAPRLSEFQRAHPKILVNLLCAMSPVDVLRLEAHIAVQLSPPEAKDVRRVKLGRFHIMPFVAKSYVELYGKPKSFLDVANHRLVLQVQQTPQFNLVTKGAPQLGRVAVRTNVSSATYAAISKGAGVGWLPSYAAMFSSNLIPLDLGYVHEQDIWLAYHADVSRIARVRRLIDWVISVFSPKKYPWFADRFVHPNDFPANLKKELGF